MCASIMAADYVSLNINAYGIYLDQGIQPVLTALSWHVVKYLFPVGKVNCLDKQPAAVLQRTMQASLRLLWLRNYGHCAVMGKS
jgi:hypothetical protein